MINKRWVGKKLEIYVSDLFKEIYKYARPTKNSGARNEAGDDQQPFFVIETKVRNTESITIHEKTWNKLVNKIPLHSQRLPLYILRNKNNKNWAVLKLEDFMEIFKRSLKNDN